MGVPKWIGPALFSIFRQKSLVCVCVCALLALFSVFSTRDTRASRPNGRLRCGHWVLRCNGRGGLRNGGTHM